MTRSSLFRVLLVLVAAAVLVAGCQAAARQTTLYHCPMHPDYVSDKPGDCPICGMKLVPFEKGTAPKKNASHDGHQAASAPAAQAPGTGGHDHQQEAPTAPLQAAGEAHQASEHQHQAPAGDGQAAVHTNPETAALAGVRTAAATTGTLSGTIRAAGTVVTPETGVRQVTTKVAGWVQKLYVNSVGRPVRAGEPLFELYSPELLASQEEYVKARQVAGQFATSSLPEVQKGGQDLAATARRRLELFDVPPDFITRLEETGKVQRTVTFRAPFSGYVTEKTVVEGQRIEPGMNLMTLADLSQAWVTAQVYEAEAAAATPGRPAIVSLPYDSTKQLRGRIDLVYPTLDAESRTLKVRLAFPNPRLALKPGMFVNVELEAQRAQGVIVPDSAVIDTGARQVVFVESAPGHFEPRDVQVALRSQGQIVLRSGLKAGEQVATAANFLLDSESRLRAAVGAGK